MILILVIKQTLNWSTIEFKFVFHKNVYYYISSLNVSKEHVCVDWDVKKTHKMKDT
jgi:hypothetical protein